MKNPLWTFSTSCYSREGVADACLKLQDEFGLDVNMLLYAVWLAQQGQCLESGHLEALQERISQWREEVVQPLRSLRRSMREVPRAGDLREKLKFLELQAEQQQQNMMYAYWQNAAGLAQAQEPLEENLRAVARNTCPGDKNWVPEIEHLTRLLTG